MQLRSVFVLVRHGSRTPCHPQYCFDVEFSKELIQHPVHTFTPIQVIHHTENAEFQQNDVETVYDDAYLKGGECKPGQLAAKGAQDQYLIGVMLRQSYIENEHLLPPDYDQEDIFVQCSNFERTIDSSRCILAGLYPVKSSSSSPIPVYVATPIENLALPANPYLRAIKKLLGSNPSLVPDMQDAVNRVKDILSLNENVDLSYLWDNLKTLKELDLLPNFPNEVWNLCSSWGAKWFKMRTLGTEKCRYATLQLGSGMVIDYILNKIDDLQRGKRIHKLYLIIGHDHTLWSLMHVLKMKDIELPPSTSSVLALEVYESSDNSIYINVVFNKQRQKIADESECDINLEKFISLVENYRLSKKAHKEMCKELQLDENALFDRCIT